MIAAVATLELLVLVIVGVALVAKPMAHRAIAERRRRRRAVTKPKPEPMLPLLPRRLTSVTILNGNGVSGAAATEASRVRARGYKVGQVGNAPRGGFGSSVVMYRAGRIREARRLARDLGHLDRLATRRPAQERPARREARRRGRRLILK